MLLSLLGKWWRFEKKKWRNGKRNVTPGANDIQTHQWINWSHQFPGRKNTLIPQKVPQNVCLSFVLCSWAKEVSNYTIIEFYEKHITHLCKYQEKCSHLEVDKQVVSKFLGAQLKKNNISKVQQALASSCKQSQSSSLNPLQYKLFMEKLNGSFARTTAKDLIINASVSLREIQDSSMNKEKLPVEFISIINELKLHNKATCSWSFVHSHFFAKTSMKYALIIWLFFEIW